MFYLLLIFSLFSEYRTYLLDVHINSEEHIVLKSSLDHEQFKSWYPGLLKVDLLDSWMCYGDTSKNKDYCEKHDASLGKDNLGRGK